jgi:hypothetical protein
MKKNHIRPNQACIVDVLLFLFYFWPQYALPRVLCGNAYLYDEKSTSQAKDLVSFNDYTSIKVPEL